MLSGFVSQFRRRLVTYLVLLAVLLFTLHVYYPIDLSQDGQSQPVSAEVHATLIDILAINATAEDFGLMGRKVALLRDLAEHFDGNPSLCEKLLTNSVVQEFPWWNPNTSSYFPWNVQTRNDSWTKDVPLLRTGIVVCAGDANAREAAFLIASLRNVVQSKLPIQIAYNGDTDLSPGTRRFLERTGDDVSCLDLTKVFDDSSIGLSGWATKPFAILASQFPRTILMDADTIFFSCPDDAFRRYPGLSDTGALFFHDRSVNIPFSEGRLQWVTEQIEQAGRQPSPHLNHSSLFFRGYTTEEQDSATVFVDKSRPGVYMAMLLAAWMNTKDIRDAVTWRRTWGDKETYWLASELAGVPYTFEPWLAAQLGELGRSVHESDGLNEDRTSSPFITRSIHMAHSDANGEEPFWANGGILWYKGDRELGFANWTHWFLGSRVDAAIEDFALNPTGMDDIMASQANWDDEKDHFQHDVSGWRELSPTIRRVIEASIVEANKINERYQQEIG